jgi:hypothetical protein
VKGPLPSITPAQIAAVLKWAIGIALALGLNLTPTAQAEVIGSSTAVALAITLADLFLRRGRQRHLGHLLSAGGGVDQVIATAQRIAELADAERQTQLANDPKPPPPGTEPVQLAGETEATGS